MKEGDSLKEGREYAYQAIFNSNLANSSSFNYQ